MRVSEAYQLNRTQPTLDFVDVDTVGDLPVFVDPRALRLLPSEWGAECVSLVQSFFRAVLRAIVANDDGRAQQLLRSLREPNETHLGLSKHQARGRALGWESAEDVWTALKESEAARSGLLEDLEDTILMVEGIGPDIVSDITTNIIREPLVRYTNDVCDMYGIPLVPNVDPGPLWDSQLQSWHQRLLPLPVTNGNKLLLVPKVIVRRHMDYDADEYYRNYLLEFLCEVELSASTELVRLLKDGRRRINKKDLIAKYGRGKRMIVRETLRHPEVLQRYREAKRRTPGLPLGHNELAIESKTEPPDWSALLGAVRAIPVGREHADTFHGAIEELLTALFYEALVDPRRELQIHEGRKRIDITFTNVARRGFFAWVAQHYPAGHLFVECKNYADDPANPELDQISGRFSPSRGQIGLLVCRTFHDKELFVRRCRDTANDHRGFIVALDDDDLSLLVAQRQGAGHSLEFPLLKTRFDKLIM